MKIASGLTWRVGADGRSSDHARLGRGVFASFIIRIESIRQVHESEYFAYSFDCQSTNGFLALDRTSTVLEFPMILHVRVLVPGAGTVHGIPYDYSCTDVGTVPVHVLLPVQYCTRVSSTAIPVGSVYTY